MDTPPRSLLQVLKDIGSKMGATRVIETRNDGDPLLHIFVPERNENHAAPDVAAQAMAYEAANLAWLATHVISAIGRCIDGSDARNGTIAGYIADITPTLGGQSLDVFVAGFDEIAFPMESDTYRHFLAAISPRQHH